MLPPPLPNAAPLPPPSAVLAPPIGPAAPPPSASGPAPVPPAATPPGRRVWPWVVLGAALLAMVGIGVWGLTGEDDGGPGPSEAEGPVAEDGAYLSIEVDLQAGDAVRFRAEPGAETLDTYLAVVADRQVADDTASRLVDDFAEDFNDFPDFDEDVVYDEFFVEGRDVFVTGDVADDLGDQVVVQDSDVASEGAVDADYFVAIVDGTYRIVVTSYAGEGPARLVVERSPDRLDLSDGLTVLYDQTISEDEFFNEDAFFVEQGRYEPA